MGVSSLIFLQKDLSTRIMKLLNYLLPLLLVASCSAFSFSALLFGDQEAKIEEAAEQPAVADTANEEPVEAAQIEEEDAEQEEEEDEVEEEEDDDNEEEDEDEDYEEDYDDDEEEDEDEEMEEEVEVSAMEKDDYEDEYDEYD